MFSPQSCPRPVISTLLFVLLLALQAPLAIAVAADTPATPIDRPEPIYPKDASGEGWVQLEFKVGVDGKPHDVSVVDAQPRRMFESAAVKAVSKWTFKPAMREGAPVESHSQIKISFRGDDH